MCGFRPENIFAGENLQPFERRAPLLVAVRLVETTAVALAPHRRRACCPGYLRGVGMPVVVDRMSNIPTARGVDDPVFHALVRLWWRRTRAREAIGALLPIDKVS